MHPSWNLGRALGPARGTGNETCQWTLKSNGKLVPRMNVRILSTTESYSYAEVKKREVFNKYIMNTLGSAMLKTSEEEAQEDFIEYKDRNEESRIVPNVECPKDSQGTCQQIDHDRMTNAEVALKLNDSLHLGKVKKRIVWPEGKVKGSYNDNPALNTISYDVEFHDGQVRQHAANIIAENMLSRADEEGFSKTIIKSIVDFDKDDSAASMKDKWVYSRNGRRVLRKSTTE